MISGIWHFGAENDGFVFLCVLLFVVTVCEPGIPTIYIVCIYIDILCIEIYLETRPGRTFTPCKCEEPPRTSSLGAQQSLPDEVERRR